MDERLEALLNRAGNTLSDLPTFRDWEKTPNDVKEERRHTLRTYAAESGWHKSDAYVMHLADIIDRLEWALSNTLDKLDVYEGLVATLAEYGTDGITFSDSEEEEEDEDAVD